MCTGPYEFTSWTAGGGVTATASPDYWNPSVRPMVKQIVIKGVPRAASFTSGMLTGAIQGSYYFGLSNLSELEHSSAVRVYQGPGESTDAFIVSATSGPLANVKVRQALSLALDRQAIISNVYDGAALMPRWLANPGTFGYGTSVFDAAYNSSPPLSQNLGRARTLVKQAGVGRPDHHHRHVQRAGQHLRRDRRLPAGRRGDRAEGGAQVGVGRRLHQLLHQCPGARRASTASSPSTTATMPTRLRCWQRSRCLAATRTTTTSVTRR